MSGLLRRLVLVALPAVASLAVVALGPASAPAALPPQVAQQLYEKARPSLVAVQYTYAAELGRREIVGAGVVVRDDGLVMCSMSMLPVQLPDEQMVEFKIIIPGDEETEIDAVFQGRDERSGVAFVKPAGPLDKTKNLPRGFKWVPLKFEETAVQVGQTVACEGLLPKTAGYHPYFSQPLVSAVLRGPTPQVLVSTEGLCVLGSPVLREDGVAIGLVNYDAEQSPLLNDTRNPMTTITNPPRLYVPARDFLQSLQDPPSADHPLKLPWMGVAQMIGLKKEVAEYYDLKGQPAVQVGDVIAGFSADRAGLKAGMIIVKVDGKPLERGDEPDEAAMILLREVRRLRPGAKVTFSVLTDKDQPLKEISVTLEERPKQANQASRFYGDDLGFGVREMVFEDTYERHLPAETKGVLVTVVKPSSSAQSARLAPNDLVTRLNQSNVTTLEQFKEQYQAYRKAHPRDAVVLEVLRGVNTQIIRIEAPQ